MDPIKLPSTSICPSNRPLPPPQSRRSVRSQALTIQEWESLNDEIIVAVTPPAGPLHIARTEAATLKPTRLSGDPGTILQRNSPNEPAIPNRSSLHKDTSKGSQPKRKLFQSSKLLANYDDSKAPAEDKYADGDLGTLCPSHTHQPGSTHGKTQAAPQTSYDRYRGMFVDSDEEMDEGYFSLLTNPQNASEQLPQDSDGHAAMLANVHARAKAMREARESHDPLESPSASFDTEAEAARRKVEEDGVRRLRELRARAFRFNNVQEPLKRLSTTFLEQSDMNGASNPPEQQLSVDPATDNVPGSSDHEGLLDFAQDEARRVQGPGSSIGSSRSLSSSPTISGGSTDSTSTGLLQEAVTESGPIPPHDTQQYSGRHKPETAETLPASGNNLDRRGDQGTDIDFETAAKRYRKLQKTSRNGLMVPKTMFRPSDNHVPPMKFHGITTDSHATTQCWHRSAKPPFPTQHTLPTKVPQFDHPSIDATNLPDNTFRNDGRTAPADATASGSRLALLVKKRAQGRDNSDVPEKQGTAIPALKLDKADQDGWYSLRAHLLSKNATQEEHKIALEHNKAQDRIACFKLLQDAFVHIAKLDCCDRFDTKIIGWLDEVYAFNRKIIGGKVYNRIGRSRVAEIRDNAKRRMGMEADNIDENQLQEPLLRIAGQNWAILEQKLEEATVQEEQLRLLKAEEATRRQTKKRKPKHTKKSVRPAAGRQYSEDRLLELPDADDSDDSVPQAKKVKTAKPKLTVEEKRELHRRIGIEREDRRTEETRLKLELFNKRQAELNKRRETDPCTTIHDVLADEMRPTSDDEINRLENERQAEQKIPSIDSSEAEMLAHMKRKAATGQIDMDRLPGREEEQSTEHDTFDHVSSSGRSVDESSEDSDSDSEPIINTEARGSDAGNPSSIQYTIHASFNGMESFGYNTGSIYEFGTSWEPEDESKYASVNEKVRGWAEGFSQMLVTRPRLKDLPSRKVESAEHGLVARSFEVGSKDDIKASFHFWAEQEEMEPTEESEAESDDIAPQETYTVVWERNIVDPSTGIVRTTHKTPFDEIKSFRSSVHANLEAKQMLLEWVAARTVSDKQQQRVEQLKGELEMCLGFKDWLFDHEVDGPVKGFGLEARREKLRVWII